MTRKNATRYTSSLVLNDAKAGDERLIRLINEKRAVLEATRQTTTTQAVFVSLLNELEQRRAMDESIEYPDPSVVLNVATMETILNSKLKWLAGHIIQGITEKLASLATVAPQRQEAELSGDDYTLAGIDDVLQQLGWGS